MPGCAAGNCTNHSRKGFRLFAFPSHKERRIVWENFCWRKNWESTKYSRLCEQHFKNDQFEQNRQDGLKKLKPNAIPTLFSAKDKTGLHNNTEVNNIIVKTEDYATSSSNIKIEPFQVKTEVEFHNFENLDRIATNKFEESELLQTKRLLQLAQDEVKQLKKENKILADIISKNPCLLRTYHQH